MSTEEEFLMLGLGPAPVALAVFALKYAHSSNLFLNQSLNYLISLF